MAKIVLPLDQCGSLDGRWKIMVRKRILTLCLSVVMVVSLASVCFAASFDFTSSSDMKFVDSNAWTYVCAEKKDSAGKTASLSVNQIYNSNCEPSLYQKVHAKATSSGTSVSASKGSVTSVAIPDAYQAAGKSVPLYCKGNNLKFDCYITGTWSVG